MRSGCHCRVTQEDLSVTGRQQDTIKQCKVWEWATREFFLKKGDSVVIDRFRFLFEYFSMAWVMKSVEIV